MSSRSQPIYQVDAFTNELFGGNPAAVVPLQDWLPTEVMQQIALENNLSETAFIVDEGEHYHIRWFTPKVEVDLCGHATLASASVIFDQLNYPGDQLRFQSRSGFLEVRKEDSFLVMDFPADPPHPTGPPVGMLEALGIETAEVFKGNTDYMGVVEHESAVARAQPDFAKLGTVEARGVILTAPGEEVDFVSRFFAPGTGINEDPVTGSAHCTLTPYWSQRLQKKTMQARQISERGGALQCTLQDHRVILRGQAVLYLTGQIAL